MGGRVWSLGEEHYFWRTAVAQSLKRVGMDVARPQKSWNELASNMQAAMADNARREYSGTMLFEHWFQNIVTGRVSPNAIKYVRKYMEKGGRFHTNDSRKSHDERDDASSSYKEEKPNPPKSFSGQDEAKESVAELEKPSGTSIGAPSSVSTSANASTRGSVITESLYSKDNGQQQDGK